MYIPDRDWEDMKKMPEHQTLVKDFKKIKYNAVFCLCLNCLVVIIRNRNSNSSGLNNSSKPVCISLRLGLIQRLILCWCCILMMLIYVLH